MAADSIGSDVKLRGEVMSHSGLLNLQHTNILPDSDLFPGKEGNSDSDKVFQCQAKLDCGKQLIH